MRRIAIIAAALAAAWIGYAIAAQSLAAMVAAKAGGLILKAGQGKVSDPAVFVQGRIREALWLSTLALAWILAQWFLSHLARKRWPERVWAVHGILGFLFLNAWTAAAMNTVLLWAVLGVGGGFQNLMQFQFKRLLLMESRSAARIVLAGSSQTRAQIDENLLNQEFKGKLWTSELHYPGSHAYDIDLIYSKYRRARPKLVIIYLTEGYFHNASHGPALPDFLEWSDLPYLLQHRALRYFSADEIAAGLFGAALPLYRCREPIAQRFFGERILQMKQQQYNIALEADLQLRAHENARGYRIRPDTAFQKAAFEHFIARCESDETKVMVLMGGMNPILSADIEPVVRADMVNCVQELAGRYRNLIVVPEAELPKQTAADYVDLTHVNTDMQVRFTAFLAGKIRELKLVE